MNKKSLLIMSMLLSTSLVGCGNKNVDTNKAPTIVGVKDFKCIVNSKIDFLDGVAALDKEDGDITPVLDIKITPEVKVEDGYATFTEPGEYVVNYTIKDKEGKEAKKKSYVDVITRKEYRNFKMAEGFKAYEAGKAKITNAGMVNGKFKFVASGGEVAEELALSKEYEMTTNKAYTFHYEFTSNVQGKVKALANGVECGEANVKIGNNSITFTHVVRSNEDDSQKINIDLCLGALGNEIDLTFNKFYYEFAQEEGATIDYTDGYTFFGNVIRRFDPSDGGEAAPEGNAWAGNEGKEAVLEVTKPCSSIWLGGMFIDTGVKVKDDCQYQVSFDVEAENDGPYEVVIQRDQWDELTLNKLFNPKGHQQVTINPTEGEGGKLWLYVQSGNNKNRIVISNLSVVETLKANGVERLTIEDFTEFHNGAFPAALTTNEGSFKYTISRFADHDYDQKVSSPSFYVSGSGANYVISFKAKATKPVEMVVAAPIAKGWDPTIMWAKVNVTTEEQVFTFMCDGKGADRDYQVVWQFGGQVNQQYTNVEIEISDVTISLKNRELDG